MASKYRGFSTIGQFKKFQLSDIELVKRDLLNHFSIRKGEKLMQPNFGSIIWDLLYEPLTPEVQEVLTADIKQIIEYDPRVSVLGVIIDQLDSGIQVQVDLNYLPGNYSESLILKFDSQSRTLTTA